MASCQLLLWSGHVKMMEQREGAFVFRLQLSSMANFGTVKKLDAKYWLIHNPSITKFVSMLETYPVCLWEAGGMLET